MKVSKKRKPSPIVESEPVTYGTTATQRGMTPYNQTEYPQTIESEGDVYHRLYTRTNFIIYEIYNAADYIVGFLCINARSTKLIQDLPFYTMWKQMEEWADRCEQDDSLKPLARQL